MWCWDSWIEWATFGSSAAVILVFTTIAIVARMSRERRGRICERRERGGMPKEQDSEVGFKDGSTCELSMAMPELIVQYVRREGGR